MIEKITSVLLESYETFFNKLADYLPSLIGALLILILGWIIAKLVKTASIKLLKLIKLDVVTEKAKIDQFLLKFCGNPANQEVNLFRFEKFILQNGVSAPSDDVQKTCEAVCNDKQAPS